jgi:PhzF family phenazine biosynthesis protein
MKIYQVDAFADTLFAGNPAAVVPLEQWIPDHLMQQLAAENNLAETVFFVKEGSRYQIRWFTPLVEVPLCGHATVASAHVLAKHLGETGSEIIFDSKSGLLPVSVNGDMYTLNFPSDHVKPASANTVLEAALGIVPQEVHQGSHEYLLVVLQDETQVTGLKPDLRKMMELDASAIIVTAQSSQYDFVSRFFAPQKGVDEDPVTGSAHTRLIPYWAKRLGKNKLLAKQVSTRGGELTCEYLGERVLIGGKAVTYLVGEFFPI